ncbi:hypothetical protein TNCV_3008211 [Trichonephila clavipes]|nr:hypothetical protein TNCV_3008211 [Trichonephila clavipes]
MTCRGRSHCISLEACFVSLQKAEHSEEIRDEVLIVLKVGHLFYGPKLNENNVKTASKHRWFSGRMLACHAGGPVWIDKLFAGTYHHGKKTMAVDNGPRNFELMSNGTNQQNKNVGQRFDRELSPRHSRGKPLPDVKYRNIETLNTISD